jgi:hypothetical protein
MPVLSPDLTIPEITAVLGPDQIQTLEAIDDGRVRSTKPERDSGIRLHGPGGGYITDTVRDLRDAGLARRAGTDWYLTPAGTLILNRHAGGAS